MNKHSYYPVCDGGQANVILLVVFSELCPHQHLMSWGRGEMETPEGQKAISACYRAGL